MDVSDMEEADMATIHWMFVGNVTPVKDSHRNSGVKLFEELFMDDKRGSVGGVPLNWGSEQILRRWKRVVKG